MTLAHIGRVLAVLAKHAVAARLDVVVPDAGFAVLLGDDELDAAVSAIPASEAWCKHCGNVTMAKRDIPWYGLPSVSMTIASPEQSNSTAVSPTPT